MTSFAAKAEQAVVTNPRLLSLREAVVLADVPGKLKFVRKDIDSGVLTSTNIVTFQNDRYGFGWTYVVAFAAVYGNDLILDSRALRKTALDKVFDFTNFYSTYADNLTACSSSLDSCIMSNFKIVIDRYLEIPLGRVCEALKPRISLYSEGLARVEERDPVMGGAAVFRDTRLPVHHVAKMIEDGESIENILEDYPYLTREDIEFACLYNHARPPVGRPRVNRKAVDDSARDAR